MRCSAKMKNNNLKFEMKRKFIHIFGLLYIAIYFFFYNLYNHEVGLLALVVVLLFFLILEFYRIKLKKKIPIFHIFWRAKEKNRLGGQIYFLIGAIIVFSVFETKIAIVSLLMTVFGDMAAALIGIKFGKHWIKGLDKIAWEGVIAEFFVNILIAFFILDSILIVIGMALTATFVETVFKHVDDNLSIPVSSGAVGQILNFVKG